MPESLARQSIPKVMISGLTGEVSQKTAFASTKGHAIKLLLMLLFYMIFALVIEKAAQFTLGSVFIIFGKMMDSPFTGKVLEAIVQSTLASAFGMVSAVFVAMLYKRLI